MIYFSVHRRQDALARRTTGQALATRPEPPDCHEAPNSQAPPRRKLPEERKAGEPSDVLGVFSRIGGRGVQDATEEARGGKEGSIAGETGAVGRRQEGGDSVQAGAVVIAT